MSKPPVIKRVVSGIQPTGNLHLGNYLGAIRNWVRMQDEVAAEGGRCFFFLADLHAITVHNEPAELRRNVRAMAATLIAAGIDPARATLFNQAAVPAHAELAWVLNCTARIGWLNRMTQFKEKSGKDREGASIGLFAYPVLQAADVLLYGATHVPVGDDQKQHLELARDIATKFNADFATDLFTLPEAMIPPAAARIMSLRDGGAKMSKSDPSDMSRINLTDDADTLAAKIRKAKTDAEPLPDDPKLLESRAEARNLVAIYATLAEEPVEAILARFAGQGFGVFKPALAELVVETLRPIGERLATLEADPAELDRLIAAG
ncbi:MAG TPA: tryptophan--tRNA ligase, partial [Sphingomonas sp.]